MVLNRTFNNKTCDHTLTNSDNKCIVKIYSFLYICNLKQISIKSVFTSQGDTRRELIIQL